MTFEYAWTEDNRLRLYWGGDEITDEPIENEGPGKTYNDGIPIGAREYASKWVASQSVPDETRLQDAIEQLAAILANDFEDRGAD